MSSTDYGNRIVVADLYSLVIEHAQGISYRGNRVHTGR